MQPTGFPRGVQMSFRKPLISLSLLALMSLPALAQDQTSQTPNAQPQASQPQTAKDQTAQPQSTQPTSGTATGSAPVPPQDPAPTPTPSPDSTSSAGSEPAPSGPPPIQEPDDSKVKHNGSKSDVDAIGNRKVGGRGMGNWYSLETEIRMGKQYAMQVEQGVKLVQDPVVTEYC